MAADYAAALDCRMAASPTAAMDYVRSTLEADALPPLLLQRFKAGTRTNHTP